MKEKRYSIGIDYGTLSARAVVVDVSDGKELSEAVYEYPHGVMDKKLPSGVELEVNTALEHPKDYLEALRVVIPKAMADAGITADEICGVGVDFTTCTLLPVYKDGTPLCFDKKYENEPHAYAKLWKHHASLDEAEALTRIARERGESWLSIYGGTVSCEWAIPKIWQVLNDAPEVYEDTARFVEGGDFIAWMLTGKEVHSATYAGYKALWNAETGYPSKDFFAALDERMRNLIGTKLSDDLTPISDCAGVVSAEGAKLCGLREGTPVAVSMPDAHAALPALNVTRKGELIIIMGTSAPIIVHDDKKLDIPGICGYVKDATIPGLYTYEAGQACFGDGFDKFVKNYVPESYMIEAREKGVNIHKLLRDKASGLAVGESGLICLDWFNGNRSILVDDSLSGVIVGLTLSTTPEAIYRSLIEAGAFGSRMIIENFVQHGIEIKSLCAAGGIARKDEMLMQIYADVTNCEIRVGGTTQAGALGSAIYAAVAGGAYANVVEAAEKMSKPDYKVYKPDSEAHEKYNKLYAEYKTLHDYFGRGGNDVMKRLK